MKKNNKSDNRLAIEKHKAILLVGVFGVCIIGSAFTMISSFKGNDDKVLTQTEQQMQEISNEKLEDTDLFTEEEKGVLSEEDRLSFAMGDFTQRYESALKLGKESSPEYPKQESSNLYKNLLDKAQNSRFDEMIRIIEEQAYNYKFHEEYNWKIGDLYYDATVLLASLDAPIEGKGHMIKNLKDPNMLVIGTLLMPEESRRVIISSKDSLSPIFSGNVKIRNSEVFNIEDTKDSDDFYLRQCYEDTLGVYKVHRINVEIEQKPLNAYLLEFEDGTFEFYTLQKDGDYECSYKTIQYWLDLDDLFGENKPNIYDREEVELPENSDIVQ